MIKSRFHIPVINKNIVSREELINKLKCAQEQRLTLIVAPAGYGKTTAVLDWLGRCGLPAAWLSLNSYENAPIAFWSNICTVLDEIVPNIKKDAEYVLSSQELLSADIHIDILTGRLSEVNSDFVLVLDDIHLINDTSILHGLSYLIDYMPARMHLILIGRTEPNLELAKYRIKWQMQKIDIKDLRFHKRDIRRFFQARGFAFGAEEIEKLENYTEGWIASLVAIAMTLKKENQNQIALDSLSALGGDIGQYLKNEVFDRWPDEERLFALKTSILETLSESVCDAVTGDGNALRMLPEIHRENGFLSELGEGSGEYRFHHLFKGLLYKLLPESDLTGISELHTRAGVWYAEHGMTERAVEHFLSGGLYGYALEEIEKIDTLHRYDYRTLMSWITRLPEPLGDNNFKVAYIHSLYYIQMEKLELARLWEEKMKAIAALPKYSSTPEQTAFCRTACFLNETNLLIRQGSNKFLSYFMLAIESFDANYYRMPDFIDFNTSDVYFYRCPISILARLFGENSRKFEESAENFRSLIHKNPGYKPLAAGEYLYESNRLDEALPYLLEAVDEAQDAGCAGALVPAMVDVARIKRVNGDIRGAFDVLSECESKLKRIGKIHWSYLVSACQCRTSLDSGGDTERVEAWYSSYKLNVFAEISKIREFELIVYSRVLILKERLQDAEILLQRLLTFTGKMKRTHSMVEVLNILGILEYQRGRHSKALSYLDRSITVGREHQYVRSYLDEGASMTKLLSLYLRRRPDSAGEMNARYAGFLLAEMKPCKEEEIIPYKCFESLTPREREVLVLLLEAYTNQEISGRMGITLQTVKIHIGNIYGKFGVKNRVQCLKLVQELRQMT